MYCFNVVGQAISLAGTHRQISIDGMGRALIAGGCLLRRALTKTTCISDCIRLCIRSTCQQSSQNGISQQNIQGSEGMA